ncbi:MAG: protein kinase, partial [Myxococcales bacterium]|nr:protein kinase [Myxococcales bacterium]
MSEALPEFPSALLGAIRSRRLIPVVGPDVSALARDALGSPLFPGWRVLLERAADRLAAAKLREEFRVRTYLDLDPPDIASAIRQAQKGLGDDWFQFLAEELDPPRSLVVDSSLEIAQALWTLRAPLTVTVLHDRVLEWAYPDAELRRWVVAPPTRDLDKLRASLTSPHVWHLYGHVDHVDELILAPERLTPIFPSFSVGERFAEGNRVLAELSQSQPLLIVGFSGEVGVGDLDRLCEVLSTSQGPHYALVPEEGVDRFRAIIGRAPVELIRFSERGHGLANVLEALAEAIDEPTAAPREATAPREADAPIRERGRDHSDISTAALVAEISGPDLRVPIPSRGAPLAEGLPDVPEMAAEPASEDDAMGTEHLSGMVLLEPDEDEQRARDEDDGDALIDGLIDPEEADAPRLGDARDEIELVSRDITAITDDEEEDTLSIELQPPAPAPAREPEKTPAPRLAPTTGNETTRVIEREPDDAEIDLSLEDDDDDDAPRANEPEPYRESAPYREPEPAPYREPEPAPYPEPEPEPPARTQRAPEAPRRLPAFLQRSTPRPLTPSYDDEQTQALSEELERAIERRKTLRKDGRETGDVEAEIAQLRRQLREGGHLKAGDSLGDGRYLLVRRVGQGGFATVWMAYDRALEKHVAIKVLHGQYARDDGRRERFFRGAKKMADLDHPAIVRVIDLHGQESGYHYFVMEYVDGYNLRDAVRRNILPREQVVPVIIKISEALAHAHSRGMIHRDVKPSNILITKDDFGHPRLTDFDLVRAEDTTGGTRTSAMGSFIYGAPEVVDRAKDANKPSDVYSLAMTCVFGLHGGDLTMAVVRDSAQFINRLPTTRAIKDVLKKAVDWNPNRRFASADAFGKALAQALEGIYEPPAEPAARPPPDPNDSVRVHEGTLRQTRLEHLEPGTIVASRFRVITCMGNSGLGTLYLGERINTRQRVTIKVLTDEWQWIRSGEGGQRFRNVALAASRTGQPNILEVFDAGTLEDGRLYMVMEYIEGYNLYAEIQERGRLPTRRACRIVRAIARAIRAAHDAGVIHRDLKPVNVMFIPLPDGEGEAVQVFDFGISAWAEAEARLNDPSVFIATPEYMAPEQVRGVEPTPLFDIYALGVMFYEMLVGAPPFYSDDETSIMMRKISEKAPSLGDKRPELPHNLIMLVDDCLAIDPTKRPQSAREFLAR